MTSGWGSPFKLGELVGAVSKTLQTLDQSIDKAVGVSVEDKIQATNGSTENTETNNTKIVSSFNSPVASKSNSTSTPTPQAKDPLDLEKLLNEDIEETPKTKKKPQVLSSSTPSPVASSSPLASTPLPPDVVVTPQSDITLLPVDTAKPSHEPEAELAPLPTPSSASTQTDPYLKDLEQKLQNRENQLEIFIKDNAALRTEIEQLRSVQGSSTAANDLRAEFSKRLGDLERKILSLKKERDDLKKQLEENSLDTNANQVQQLKEEIETLRMEGEKLSKKQLNFESTIKKLRATKEEQETTIKHLQERLTNTEQLLEAKVNKVKEYESNQRKINETISNMKDVSDSSSKQLEELRRALDASQLHAQELQSALEKAWRDLAEQKKIADSAVTKAQLLAQEAEEKTKEFYQTLISKNLREFSEKESSLSQIIQELRSTITRLNERAAWREDELNKEIQSLKLRLQAAESRNEELASTVPETTRPLLRQIEALQASNSERVKVWEELEKNLTSRLSEAEIRAQQAVEKERAATAQLNEITLRMKTFESECTLQRSSISRLTVELEMEKSRFEDKEKEVIQLTTRQLSTNTHYEQQIQELKQKAEELNRQLVEANQRESTLMKELQAERDRQSDRLSASGSTLPMQRNKSYSEMFPLSSSSSSLSLSSMEKTNTLFKQRDGENSVLIMQNSQLQKSVESLRDEVVKLTSKNEELQQQVESQKDLRNQFDLLSKRYNMALDLLGEKEEMVEEMKADIADLKKIYQSQINELVEQVERLSKK
mmetsp:Transcript_4216/g.5903  ORF Transcript_4216/g.5903 Transcript_4216/m.5903 type:complete len:775 (-) Transcript_4216:562-2886(-)